MSDDGAVSDVSAVAASLQHTVGNVYGVAVRRIEASDIASFVASTEDPRPLYGEREAARQGPWGTIVAPPTFLATIRGEGEARVDFGYGSHGMLGGSALEVWGPVRAGDTIVAVETVSAVRGTVGRAGPMLIVETETEYLNGEGEAVGRGRSTIIRRE